MSDFFEELDEAVGAELEAHPGTTPAAARRLARNRIRTLELLDWAASLFSDVALRYGHSFEFSDLRFHEEDPRSLVLIWTGTPPLRSLTLRAYEEDGAFEWFLTHEGTPSPGERREAAEVTTETIQDLVLSLIRRVAVAEAR